MSPSDLMIRTIHWVCGCCGQVTRTATAPRDCAVCGRAASTLEQALDASLPSD